MNINSDVNANNWLTKEYMIKYLIGILSIVHVNVLNDTTSSLGKN